MITVKLNKANFEYDIHSLVKAFFPAEDVLVFADEKNIEEPVLFHIDVRYDEENGVIAICFPEDIVRYNKSVEVDFDDRKETKNSLKKLLYTMLSEYTKKELPWGTLTGIRPTKIPMKMFRDGKTREDVTEYMKRTYYTSDEKIELSMNIAEREIAMLEKLDYENGYSLYIGIPFCPSTCLYCSFTSYPLGMWRDRMDEYVSAVEREIDFVAQHFKGKTLNTIYIGGGTPTTLEADQLDRLISKVKSSLDLTDLLEFTVEAGRPDSITEEKLKVLRKHNISRISINPQTMKQETLDIIGRHHTVEQTIQSFKLARELGFDNINMDLIMGLPQEDIEDVRNTMEILKELSPDNVTVHSLAIKRAARLSMFKDDYKDYKMINTQEHIDLTARYAAQMGLTPYYMYRQKNMAGNFENVGYARPGMAGIYNILIMEEVQSIVALGAGSVSKRVFEDGHIERCDNVKNVELYMDKIDEMIERKRRLFQ